MCLYLYTNMSIQPLYFHLLIDLNSQEPLPFELSQLRKFFQVGDHVRVVAGRHEGETGIVVKIENNLAILFADLTMHEVCDCL